MLQEIIAKKRSGLELTADEIKLFIKAVVTGNPIYDAQIGAMLMAIAIRGMSPRETMHLTKAMVSTGGKAGTTMLKWNSVAGDKHSTGGVGDKVSIPLVPILAELGLTIPMISGRGLGFTGGTLDKLESIRGFRVELSEEEISSALDKCGCFIASTTPSICPADKIMYAIRDVTSTIDCTPLIVASILSKKIAEGSNYLIQDIKVGKAAFYKDVESAEELANSMIATSKEFDNFKMAVSLTRMDTPIGSAVGNSLEIEECIEVLRGESSPPDLIDLICNLGSQLLVMAGKSPTVEEGRKSILSAIRSGKALKRFADMCICQGVTPDDAKDLCFGNMSAILGRAKCQTEIKAQESGYVQDIDAYEVAMVCWKLGAGRKVKEDKIDYHVGCKILLKPGERIENGQPWAILHHNTALSHALQEKLISAIKVSTEKPKCENIIIKTITDS